MDRSEWLVDEAHYATLALPVETAKQYFDDEDVEWALKDGSTTDDGRVLMEVTMIEKGKELYFGEQPTAHELLEYWEIDNKILGEDGVEWFGWGDG